MTPQRWAVLNEVNTEVNRAVVAATDEEIYQTAEHWTLPDIAGDCEDYVLAKRKQLIARGFPQSALLITVVRDEDRLGHAVLTVASDMGDLVLDNKSDLIRPWSDTNYVYYKRQSRSDPQRWVALTPKAGTSTALAAIDAGRASHAPR
jgi:predicted transglutaminase-like cysteine proteinase